MASATDKVLATIMDRLEGIEGKLGLNKPEIDRSAGGQRPEQEVRPVIRHGTPEHAAWLGIRKWDSREEAEEQGFSILVRSAKTKQLWSLLDELSAYQDHADPEMYAKAVLRGKISSLESGPVLPPENAPTRFLQGMDGFTQI